MDRSDWRHVLTASSVLAIGPLAGAIAGDVRLPGGSGGATALTSERPVHGGFMLLISLSIVGATGTLGARLFGARHGILCAGLVAAWVAWNHGMTEGVLMNARGGSPLLALAIESLVVGVTMLVMVGVVERVGGGRAAGDRDESGGSETKGRRTRRSMFVGAVAVAACAGLLGVHLFGVESLKGQTVFSVFVGAVLAGAAARLVVSGPDDAAAQSASLAGFAGIALLCVAGPVAAALVHGDEIAAAAFAGQLVRIANPCAADWLAGGLLGVPIGVWWASAMMPPTQKPAVRA